MFCTGFFTETSDNEAPGIRWREGGKGSGETAEMRDERRVPESPTEYTLLLCVSRGGGLVVEGRGSGRKENQQ